MLERFPDSVYSSAAHFYRKGVEELLASYEQQVISFYEARGKLAASELREKDFEKHYGSSSFELEPASYDKQAALAVAPVSKDKLIEAKQRLEQLPAISSGRASSELSIKAESVAVPDGKFLVTSVSCDPNEKLVVLAIDPRPQNAFANINASKHGDSIEVRVADITTVGEETKSYTCFSEGDMTISSNGLITLRVEALGANALYVDNPARVILTLN